MVTELVSVTVGLVACQYGAKPEGKAKNAPLLIRCGKICDPGQTMCPYHIMISEVMEKRNNERIDAKLAAEREKKVKGKR